MFHGRFHLDAVANFQAAHLDKAGSREREINGITRYREPVSSNVDAVRRLLRIYAIGGRGSPDSGDNIFQVPATIRACEASSFQRSSGCAARSRRRFPKTIPRIFSSRERFWNDRRNEARAFREVQNGAGGGGGVSANVDEGANVHELVARPLAPLHSLSSRPSANADDHSRH